MPWEAEAQLLEKSIFQAWKKAKAGGDPEIEQLLGWIVAYCKPMSERPGSPSYVNNYEEMEWRIVYGGIPDTSRTFTPDGLVPDAYRMKFDPADVALVVFPDQDVMRRTLKDTDMQYFFARHQPNLLLLEDCRDF